MAASRTGLDQLPDGRWRARYYDADGKRHSKVSDTITEARKWRTQQLASVTEHRHVAPNDSTTVADYARSWAKARAGGAHGTGTAMRVASTVETHIAGSELGPRRIVDVRRSETVAWLTGRTRAGLGPTTLRLVLGTLRSIGQSAVDDRIIAVSPFAGRFSLPRITREPVVPLTPAQVHALVGKLPDELQAAGLTQVGLGLRAGELFGLRVGDVDFLRKTVRIERQYVKDATQTSPPKNGHARVIPAPQSVLDALAAHLARWGAADDGGLFRTAAGRPLRHNNYSHVFLAAVAAAGLPTGTTSHDLRHTYASWLLAAGESVIAVADRLGHADGRLVLTTYGHLVGGRDDHTRRAIDAALALSEDEAREQARR